MSSFGIDFGTTNSATVEWLAGGHLLQHKARGDQPFPSVLAIDRVSGEVVASGVEARNSQNTLEKSCELIRSVKTLLGKDYVRKIGPRTWTAADFVTEIFKGLKDLVGRENPLEEAVVAIPVTFTPKQRKELREAARNAGIRIKNFVSEPTAALFKNIKHVKGQQTALIFDWGGGTLDIALLKLDKDRTVTELASAGIDLGGDNLDRKIAEYIYRRFQRRHNITIPFYELDSRQLDRLIQHCETAKCNLAMKDSETIFIPGFLNELDLNLDLAREELLNLLAEEYHRAVALVKKVALHDAGCNFDQIGCVLMVGGSSRLAGLYELLQKECQDCPVYTPANDSDWDVAGGAAILSASDGTYILASNFGVELSDGSIYTMLFSGRSLPCCSGSLRFGIVEDIETARFNFVSWQGELPKTGFNSPAAKAGTMLVPCNGFVNEALDMTYAVNKDLTLEITVESVAGSQKKETFFDWHNLLFTFNLPPFETGPA